MVTTKTLCMKKFVFILIYNFIALSITAQEQSFYNLSAITIDGEEFEFCELEGKKVMIVNTASNCSFTRQYEKLQNLYEQYGENNFTIIGFPANNFLNKEPGTDEEIKGFCTNTYGVTFLMMSKISVKGKDIHPVYQWLTDKEQNGVMNTSVTWNFQKYLIDENGQLADKFGPTVAPTLYSPGAE